MEYYKAKKKRKKHIWLFGAITVLVAAAICHIGLFLSVNTAYSKAYYDNVASNIAGGEVMAVKEKTPQVLLVNKEHSVPEWYVPENMVEPDVKFADYVTPDRKQMTAEAAEALEKLFAAGEEAGVQLVGVSAYRSYSVQRSIYYRSIYRNGYRYASVYSAEPGKSEHQTGLAIDVSCSDVNYELYTRFAETDEGIWLREHCEEYGFIIRYPENATDRTGYAYEPWHIRYVGEAAAAYIKENHITLDEYPAVITYDEYDARISKQ